MVMQYTGAATADASEVIRSQEGYAILRSHRWGTPPELVRAVARYLGLPEREQPFDLDACAEEGRSWGRRYYSADKSALWHQWGKGDGSVQSVWMNPPFGAKGVPRAALRRAGVDGSSFDPFPGIDAFIGRAESQAEAWGLTVACCLPTPSTASGWRGIWSASHWLHCGRVPFVGLDGVAQRSPPGSHLIAIYDGHYRGSPPVNVDFTDWRKHGEVR